MARFELVLLDEPVSSDRQVSGFSLEPIEMAPARPPGSDFALEPLDVPPAPAPAAATEPRTAGPAPAVLPAPPPAPAPSRSALAGAAPGTLRTIPPSALAAADVAPVERTRQRMQSALAQVGADQDALVDEDVPMVTVTARRSAMREPGWSELLPDISTQIGARLETKAAGLQEYHGERRYQDARKRLWQSIVLPRAAREAAEQGINLTEHPDVIENARRIGVRPDTFARDWPKYARASAEELAEIRRKARQLLARGEEGRQAGARRRQQAAEVSVLYRPEMDEWSPKALAFDIAVSVPDLLIGAGAAVATGGLGGAAIMGATLAPEFYAEGRNRGLTDEKAQGYAALMTLAELVPEVPVLDVLTRRAGRRVIRGALDELAARAGQIAAAGGLEAASEAITEALQIGIESELLDEHVTLPEALERIARAGVIGFGVGAGVGAIPAAAETIGERARRRAERRRKEKQARLEAELAELEEVAVDDATLERQIRELEEQLGETPSAPAARTEAPPVGAPTAEGPPVETPAAETLPTEAVSQAEEAPQVEAREIGERAPDMEPPAAPRETSAVQISATRAQEAAEEPTLPPPRAPTPEEARAFTAALEAARAATETEPTEAQKKAGNYRKGEFNFAGLTVRLENPAGSIRSGVHENGERWQQRMVHDYGYIARTEGADGDAVDVFLTGAPDTGRVYVVNQVDPKTRVFDEVKVILGATSKEDAERTYLANYPRGWQGIGSIVELSTEDFKRWLATGDTRRPVRPTIRGLREPTPEKVRVPPAGPVRVGPMRAVSAVEEPVRLARKLPPAPFRPDPKEADDYRRQMRAVMNRPQMARPVRMGRTPPVLRALGAQDLPIMVSHDVLHKAVAGKHVVPLNVVERLPEELADPLLVYASATHDKALVVLTEEKDAVGDPVIAILDIRAEADLYRVNRISSVYGKQNHRILAKWVRDGLLRYKSNRASRGGPLLPGLDGLQLPDRMPGDRGKVLTEADILSMFGPRPGPSKPSLRRATPAAERPAPTARTKRAPRGVPAETVDKRVRELLRDFRIRPEVVVVQDFADLPAEQRKRLAARGVKAGEVDAFFDDGTLYFVASDVHSPEMVPELLLHEYVVHYGLRALLPAEERARILDRFARAMPEELARRGRIEFGEQWNPDDPLVRRVAAEEMLAYYGQQYLAGESIPARIRRWVDRYLALIRDAIRRLLGRDAKLDELAMRKLLQDLQAHLKSGEAISMERRFGPDTLASRRPRRGPARAPAQRAVIDTPEFRRWFGDSRVVDEHGQPLVVYHGTPETELIENFKTERGAYFTSNPDLATQYTARRGLWRSAMTGAVYPVYLSLKNPLIIDAMGKRHDNIPVPWQEWKPKVFGRLPDNAVSIQDAYDYAIKHGYDGLIVKNVIDTPFTDERIKSDVYVASRPDQIKSAIGNRGTFDPNEPNILLHRTSPAPPFYSAVIRTVESLPQKKASGPQWFATISKRPGVKPEELEWLGLKDWLGNRESVTKEELLDFIRANQILVDEVIKGEPGIATRITLPDIETRAHQHGMQVVVDDNGEIQLYYRFDDEMEGVPYADVPRELADLITRYMEQQWAESQPTGQSWHSTRTRYKKYTTPGAKPGSYRELLFTLPPRPLELELGEFEPFGSTGRARWDSTWVEGVQEMRFRVGEEDGSITYWPETFNWKGERAGPRWVIYSPSLQNAQYESLEEAIAAIRRNMEEEGSFARFRKDLFRTPHWTERNVLAHVRFDERRDQYGKRVLFIEEIQSDWHQEGRKKGYRPRAGKFRSAADIQKEIARLERERTAAQQEAESAGDDFDRFLRANANVRRIGEKIEALRAEVEQVVKLGAAVPDAPFKTSWPLLAFKRMIRWAAENGFERIAWTTGEQQADRYDLSKHISRIVLHDNSSGGVGRPQMEGPFTRGQILAYDHEGRQVLQRHVEDADELTELLGKDVADRLLNVQPTARRIAGIGVRERKLEGLDLRIGGAGMRGFYDQILPREIGKYVKQWGAKVGQTYLAAAGSARFLANDDAEKAAAIGAAPVHAIDVTPQMREAALAGLPLFHRRGEGEDRQQALRERLERLRAERARRLGMMPGVNYVPMYQGGQIVPLKASSITIGTGATARTLPIPAKPIRREHIIALLQREFGMHIYQGRPFKGRMMLGFFRPSNFEVRIRNKNDLEVTAHEVFHWLDRTFPELRKLYHEHRFSAELRGISYDATKLYEGFAEFGRLFLTQDAQALKMAPKFYAAFTETAQRIGIYDKLARIQDRMHQWYMQGALMRAMSKMGTEVEPLEQRMKALADVWADRAASESVDYLHAGKVIERTVTGTIAQDAMASPYKSLRLLAGARSTIESFLNFGTLNWTPRGLEFTGQSLKHVFEPVADVMDEALAYFVGRRAAELMRYGKENLFTRDEIEAMLDAGRKSPKAKEIEHAFTEYQAYVKRLLDFAQASGILNAQTRALWETMYQNYVPFYRLPEKLGQHRALGGPSLSQPFRRLFGGTANLRDIWDNMVLNTAIIVHASLRNMAKRQLFATIERSPLGQRFAVRIPADTTSVKVAMTQVEQVLRSLIDEAQQRMLDPTASAADRMHYAQVLQALAVLTGQRSTHGGSALDALQSQATFFIGGQPPSIPDRDSVLVNGERVWYQIADPLLWDMLTDINYHKPVSMVETVLGAAKRTLTRGVTITPEFQIANILRDTLNAFTMSKGGQVPLVSALRAMADVWRQSEDYKLFLANGGGFGNATPVGEGKRIRLRMNRLLGPGRKVNIRAILDTPGKLLDWWDRWGQAFELGTRLAEFKALRRQGVSLREAAYQAREISTDFAMHGRAPIVRMAMISLPFWNARLQGLFRLERELFERGGRTTWRGERQLRYAMRALLGITLPTLLLYVINKDDEDYEALPEETKNLYWAIKIPGTHDFVLIPKPFETGALFATIPERLWEYFERRESKKLADAAKFTLMQTFAFDPTPQIVKPVVEVELANRDWRGLPIIPYHLRNVEPREQYRWNTPGSLVAIGRQFDVSPLAIEHYLNGYFGGLGGYLIMASDSLVTSGQYGEDPTRRLSDYPVLRRFLRQAPYSTTSHMREFYDLALEVDRTVNTARKIRQELRADDLATYLGEPEKMTLFGLHGVTEHVREKAADIRAAMVAVRRDPEMSGEEKRREIDRLQRDLNELFREAVQALRTVDLERYRDALEGKVPAADRLRRLEGLIEGRPRRQQVLALDEAGWPATADLIRNLPPTPDRQALATFEQLVAQSPAMQE